MRKQMKLVMDVFDKIMLYSYSNGIAKILKKIENN